MAKRTLGPTLFVGVVGLGTALFACAQGADRQAFSSAEGTVPEEGSPTAPAPTGSTPLPAPGKDAGVPAPGPSSCKVAPPSNKCGVAPQCGCGAGETCDVEDGSGNVGCVVAGNAPLGHACTSTAGCGLGLTCVFGTCHAFCDAPGTACADPKNGECVQVQTQNGGNVPNFDVCRIRCALHDPGSCGGKTAAGVGVCMTDGKGATDCQSGGARTENQSCSQADPCGPGLACITQGASSTCKRWCRVGQTDCGGGSQCAGFGTKVLVGAVEYGACP